MWRNTWYEYFYQNSHPSLALWEEKFKRKLRPILFFLSGTVFLDFLCYSSTNSIPTNGRHKALTENSFLDLKNLDKKRVYFEKNITRTPKVRSRNYWVSTIKKPNQMANRILNFEAGNGNWWGPRNHERKLLIGPEHTLHLINWLLIFIFR